MFVDDVMMVDYKKNKGKNFSTFSINKYLSNSKKLTIRQTSSEYRRPKKRIFVEDKIRNILHNSLKNQRGVIQNLTNNIPVLTHFFHRGDTLSKSDFTKLKELIKKNFGKGFLLNLFGIDDIPHKIYLALTGSGRGFYEYKKLEITLDLSEFVCISLGDGHLNENGRMFQISSSKDEPSYLDYLKKLMKKIFGINDIKQVEDSERGVSLRTGRIDIHYSLVEIGLQVGDKVKNQISVPAFVFRDKEYTMRGIKGLFDTDGTIYVDNKGLICIGFKNRSKPLTILFNKMYKLIFEEDLGNVRKIVDEDGISWEVNTTSKRKVKQFVEIIRPEKFKEYYKLFWIGLRIIILSNFAVKIHRTLREEINSRIANWKIQNKRKIYQYSIKNTKLLKKWCEDLFLKYKVSEILGNAYNGSITNEIIKKVIVRSLEYERLIYNDKGAMRLVYLFKKLGSFNRIFNYLKYLGEDIVPDRQTIAKHIKYYITHLKRSDFEKFVNKYKLSRITFYPDSHTIKNFSKKYRNKMCEIIFSILSNNKLVSIDNIYLKLKKIIKKKEYVLVDWLLEDNRRPKYQKGMKKFLIALIHLIKNLIYMLDNDKIIVYKEISENSNVYFNEKTVRDIIIYLKTWLI